MTRRILAYFLGGTISMSGHSGGVVSRAGADALLTAVPQLADLDVEVVGHDFRRLPSAGLTFADLLELAAEARSAVQDVGAGGVVVVQGTDTIEETAYLLDLVWAGDVPLVVTGAMRNPTLAGPDGPANLLAAVAVAADDAFRGLGVLVAFADEVHAARFVRKTHSTSTGTFASPDAGPLGVLVEGRPVLLTRVARRATHEPSANLSPRVGLYLVGLDDDGTPPVDGDGLVVAGFGAGHVPARLAEPLGALAARVPVVLASRTGAGPVLSHTYGYAGSETDLLARGLIGCGLLDPLKARVLLKVALACAYDRDRIAGLFADTVG